MGWPRKNEMARAYCDRGKWILVCSEGKEHFRGLNLLVKQLDRSKWTVERKGPTVYITYDGVVQDHMGDWTTLCLGNGRTCTPAVATDAEVLQAYLGDENVYGGGQRYPDDSEGYYRVVGLAPDTWGGSAKRVSFAECPADFQDVIRTVLNRYGMTPEEARGLWRL